MDFSIWPVTRKPYPPWPFFLVPKDCSQREISSGLFSSGIGGTKAEIQLGLNSLYSHYTIHILPMALILLLPTV